MTKQQSINITLMKSIALVLVVCVHAEIPTYLLAKNSLLESWNFFITRAFPEIAVPIYLFISGYLYFINFQGDYINKFKKRFHSVFIPFVIWCSWGIILRYILQKIGFSGYFNSKLVADYGFTDFIRSFWDLDKIGPLWFLRDLLILIILTPAIKFLIDKINIFFPLLLIVILFLFPDINNYGEFKLNSLFFFSCGSYFAINKVDIFI
jgi:fucose 4-O-acetylase-like acetyltransferase